MSLVRGLTSFLLVFNQSVFDFQLLLCYKICVAITESEPIPSKVKYALVAHEKGTDYYIVATNNGNLIACCPELIEIYRTSESLISFDEVTKNILREQEESERMKIIPPGTAVDHSVRLLRYLLADAIRFLGCPPKEDVEFFSLPNRIIEELHWIPRQKST